MVEVSIVVRLDWDFVCIEDNILQFFFRLFSNFLCKLPDILYLKASKLYFYNSKKIITYGVKLTQITDSLFANWVARRHFIIFTSKEKDM